jgi:hypothetical protein
MMRKRLIKLTASIFALCGLSLIAAGCAAISPVGDLAQSPADLKTQIVEPDDVADMQYICRINNGDIIAAAGPVPADAKKSGIYLEPGDSSVCASTLEAAKPDEPLAPRDRPAGLENEIRERLARKIVGMKQGESRVIELTADMIPAPDENSGFSRLATTRNRPKEIRVPVEQFKSRYGRDARVGEILPLDPAFTARVESVTEQEVITRVIPVPDKEVKTPFGRARVREEVEAFYVDTDAKEGTLVRLGPLTGRIVSVTDKMITIDNRHPFGYETLTCDVTITGVTKAGDSKIEEKKAECKTCGEK